jgi:hypothetical protein
MWLFHQRFRQVSEQNFFSFRPWGWITHRFAAVRAETVGGGRRGDFNRLALNFRSQSIPAAECFDSILGDTQLIGYLCITPACLAHCGQAAFFL